MKKLNKLCINSEKLMKNEELVIIRGGYVNCCQCYTRDPIPQLVGYMAAWNQADCTYQCDYMDWDGTWGFCT